MSDFSEPSQAQETHGEPRLNSNRKIRLTSEEFAFVESKLSRKENKEILELMGVNLRESVIWNGVPATAIGLGALYLARTHLPPKFPIKTVGFGVFAVASLVGTFRRFRERIIPIYARLLEKYSETDPGTNYSAQHYRNRGGADWEGLVPENKLMNATAENLNATGNLKLSQEQIQYLFIRMSSDEREQIQDAIDVCYAKGVWKSVAAIMVPSAVSATIHYRRKFNIPRKPWHGLVLLCNAIIGSVITYSALFKTKGPCKDRIQPTMLAPLWQKYGGDMPVAGMSNLHNSRGGGPEMTSFVEKENKPVSAERRGKMHANMYDTFAPRARFSDYPAPVMSGTPSAIPRDRLDHNRGQGKTNSYGDEGFS